MHFQSRRVPRRLLRAGRESGQRAAQAGRAAEVTRIEQRVDKRDDCRKQVDAQKLGPIERIEFVRKRVQ
jgi:hypothetical protein